MGAPLLGYSRVLLCRRQSLAFLKEYELKVFFRHAASLIAASMLAACSGGVAPLPQLGDTSSLHVKPHMKSMYSAVCHDDITSNATACYYNQPAPDPGAPAPGGYGCTQYCSGQPIVGMPGPGGMGGGSCLTDPENCLSRIPPQPGMGCDGSQLTLGSQWPVNTTDYNHEVVNIIALQATDDNGLYGIAGYVYITGDGDQFVQGAPGFKTFWTALASSVPVIGAFVQNLDSTSAIVPVGSSTSTQIVNYFLSHNGKAGSCFTKQLPA